MRIIARTTDHAIVQADETDTGHDYIVTFDFNFVVDSWLIHNWEKSTDGWLPTAELIRLGGEATEYLNNVIRGATLMTDHRQIKAAMDNIAEHEKRLEQARDNYERSVRDPWWRFGMGGGHANRRAAAAWLDHCEREYTRLMRTDI